MSFKDKAKAKKAQADVDRWLESEVAHVLETPTKKAKKPRARKGQKTTMGDRRTNPAFKKPSLVSKDPFESLVFAENDDTPSPAVMPELLRTPGPLQLPALATPTGGGGGSTKREPGLFSPNSRGAPSPSTTLQRQWHLHNQACIQALGPVLGGKTIFAPQLATFAVPDIKPAARLALAETLIERKIQPRPLQSYFEALVQTQHPPKEVMQAWTDDEVSIIATVFQGAGRLDTDLRRYILDQWRSQITRLLAEGKSHEAGTLMDKVHAMEREQVQGSLKTEQQPSPIDWN